MENKSALNFQHGGTHYTDLKLQPLEIAYLLSASPCWTKVAKYLVREKGTHLADLIKALTCVEIEEELTSKGQGLHYFEARVEEDFVEKMIAIYTDVIVYRMALKDMYFGEYDKAKNIIKALIIEEQS